MNSATRTTVALFILHQVEIYVPYHQMLQHIYPFLETTPDTQSPDAIQRMDFLSSGAARFTKGQKTTYVDYARSLSQLAMVPIGINAADLRKLSEPAL